jgi:hypothetical protein
MTYDFTTPPTLILNLPYNFLWPVGKLEILVNEEAEPFKKNRMLLLPS